MANLVQMRLRRGAALFAATALPLASLLVFPADAGSTAADDGHTVTVGDAAEAWYAAAPIDLCTTPVGCPPQQVPTSPYPADTLHVGVAGGRETARTYVQPDLTALPATASPVDATMTLPVASGTTDGTASPDTAKIVACLVTKPFPDGTQGSAAAPPATDCGTSAKPTYDGAHGEFLLELGGFVQAWASGTPDYGIALLPDTAAAGPSDAWHVTFNGRKRTGTLRVTTDVTFRIEAISDGTSVVPAAPAPQAPVAAPAAPPVPSGVVAAPPVAQPPPLVATAPAASVPAQPVAFTRRFQYPLAFLLPLVLLVGALFFGRLFTRDLTPRRVVT